MAKSSKKSKSPFTGRWHIVSMDEWDEEYLNEEVQAFIEFDDKGLGEFQFAYVRGDLDCRGTTRDGKPAIEWSWAGNDDQDEMSGRGWAILEGDELHGMIFIHGSDESGFVARKATEKKRK